MIVPTVAFPPATPFTRQVTPWFTEPVTVAKNCCAVATCNATVAGATETETLTGAVISTKAELELVGSVTLYAVMVTVFGRGTADGAVYWPQEEFAGRVVPGGPLWGTREGAALGEVALRRLPAVVDAARSVGLQQQIRRRQHLWSAIE